MLYTDQGNAIASQAVSDDTKQSHKLHTVHTFALKNYLNL